MGGLQALALQGTDYVLWAIAEPSATLLKSFDGGNTWSSQALSGAWTSIQTLDGLAVLDSQTAWAWGVSASGSVVLLLTSNGGQKWSPVKLPASWSADNTNHQIIWTSVSPVDGATAWLSVEDFGPANVAGIYQVSAASGTPSWIQAYHCLETVGTQTEDCEGVASVSATSAWAITDTWVQAQPGNPEYTYTGYVRQFSINASGSAQQTKLQTSQTANCGGNHCELDYYLGIAIDHSGGILWVVGNDSILKAPADGSGQFTNVVSNLGVNGFFSGVSVATNPTTTSGSATAAHAVWVYQNASESGPSGDYESSDGGQTWSTSGSAGVDVTSLAAYDNNNAVDLNGLLYATINGPAQFSLLTQETPNPNGSGPVAIAAITRASAVAATADGSVIETQDGGVTWSVEYTSDFSQQSSLFNAIAAAPIPFVQNGFFAVGYQGLIVSNELFAGSYVEVSGTTANLTAVSAVSEAVTGFSSTYRAAIAVGNGGAITLSDNSITGNETNGSPWQSQIYGQPNSPNLLGVALGDDWASNAGTDTGTAWIVGAGGTILYATDGATWQSRADPNVTDDLEGVVLTGSVTARTATMWSVSDKGVLIWAQQNPDGSWGAWNELASPDANATFAALTAVADGAGNVTVWIGASYGSTANTVWKLEFSDAKGTLVAQTPWVAQQDYSVEVTSMSAVDANTAWLVGNFGSGILKTVTGGQ
jgi:photosystem II stability/assembly factor-like uncharacterized protein